MYFWKFHISRDEFYYLSQGGILLTRGPPFIFERISRTNLNGMGPQRGWQDVEKVWSFAFVRVDWWIFKRFSTF